MARKPSERFTNPAIAVAVIAAVGVIALRPQFSLLVLAGAEAIAAAGCVVMVRTTLRRTPPAKIAAAVIAVMGLFWAAMSALSVYWFAQPS